MSYPTTQSPAPGHPTPMPSAATAVPSPSPPAAGKQSGQKTSSDPIVVAAQRTADYTFALTIATFLLVVGTIITILAGEMQRRAGLRQAELARQEQFASDRALNDQNLAAGRRQQERDDERRSDQANADRRASLDQLLATIQSYDRAVNILLVAQHYPIASRTRTLRALLENVLNDRLVGAVPEENRGDILKAIIKAQETLEVAVVNQEMHDKMHESYEREGQTAAQVSQRLKAAQQEHDDLATLVAAEGDYKYKNVLEQYQRTASHRLEDLKASPDAYVAAHFALTSKARIEKASALYPMIKANCEDAKGELTRARALLGDTAVTDFVPEEITPTES